MKYDNIKFNIPHISGDEIKNIKRVIKKRSFTEDGYFTHKCEDYISRNLNAFDTFLTPSCTAALEISAMLLNIGVNDEVIMPSYTFVSSANAFVLRGAIPVFVDIRKDTLNIDEDKIEKSITKRTKAILVVHYAGVSCEMEKIQKISKKYKIPIIEDAAHAFGSTYKNMMVGSMGDIACFSFHETKNINSGVGGAIVLNNKKYTSKLHIYRQKGTDRIQFLNKKVDKYKWQDIGSSYVPGELMAAFLWGQLQKSRKINNQRIKLWQNYHTLLFDLESSNKITRPRIPQHCNHNGHIYFIITKNTNIRKKIISSLKKKRIEVTTHYEPLHSSPAGKKFGKYYERLPITNFISKNLLRLPMWIGLKKSNQVETVNKISEILN